MPVRKGREPRFPAAPQHAARAAKSPKDKAKASSLFLAHLHLLKPRNLLPPPALHLFVRSLESTLTIYLFNFQQEAEDLSGSGIRLA